ncbi:uncharacterized protein LAESUDRAFT_659563 [Laetiporus sulphureus 93-53]|uniref:Mitochondrial adapter protein MCP1 transmembrane domain-containing protein n=1 Tax=Laetiporus sulphureus 93-53 TaxID=1314785 RepID=A0A165CV37_9APHY|nr:uncharacterized protein LAESUDRAFT_659563 [Laetiporus sulphureus 93-53]KZT03481.1 hypothetical protein LAESUDRAFT_659563 [Laetiporus sulphureus 93-53]
MADGEKPQASRADVPATSPPVPSRSWRRSVQPVLTIISHGTAPFISTFLLIHLSAPILANLGGEAMASQVMMIGRELYQTRHAEPILYAALVIHPLASTLRRVLAPTTAGPVSPKSKGYLERIKSYPRNLISPLSLPAYALVLPLTIHTLTHRIYPSLPIAPIFSLSPSELDFSYVQYVLDAYPWRSWLGYGMLVGCVVWHGTEGVRLIYNSYEWVRGGAQTWRRELRKMIIVTGAVMIPVLSGLWVMSKEPLLMLGGTAERCHAALIQSFAYRY